MTTFCTLISKMIHWKEHGKYFKVLKFSNIFHLWFLFVSSSIILFYLFFVFSFTYILEYS